MQNEDIAGYRLYRDKYMHLKTKHQSNMLKLHNLEMNIMLGNFQNSQQDGETIVSLKDPIFAPVRETIKLDPGYLRKKTKELSLISNSEHNASRSDANSPKDPFALLYKLRNEPVKKEVELNDLIYAKNNKPTYASLISIPQSNTAIYSPPFEDWLEITVRGILDSKYYEHLMCSRETGKIPSNFPEFVFSWLGSFYIDIKTRNVRELEWHRKDNANEHRLNILLGLASKPTNKVWEIFTFREFLLEDLGLDELGFYLHCRFALFGGPQLCHSSGRFSNLHYLPFDKVTSVVDLLMGNLPTANLAELKSMLRSKAKDQTSSLTIESSIVLRVMLEYYKNEKKFKLRIIKDLFDQNSRENDISQMTFESFKHLVKNIDIQIQDSKLAKLYRDSWETGSGITAESFLKAANDNGFFFAQLKLKSINPKPATDQYGIIDPNSNQYSAFLYKIEVAWKTMSKDVEMIKEVIGEMGVPDVLASLHKLEGTLNRKGSIAKEEVGN